MKEFSQRRFWAKYQVDENGCWVWQGARSRKGYGRYGGGQVEGVGRRVHRIAYMLTYGPFDRSLLVCHRCDNPPCINPEHLFLGTHVDNARDRTVKSRGYRGLNNSVKTHCPRGHPYDGENLCFRLTRKGYASRTCIECRKSSSNRRYAMIDKKRRCK